MIDTYFYIMCILAMMGSTLAIVLAYLYLQAQHEVEESQDVQKNIALQASKMSALGEMAAGIAHEINTPLCAIKMFLGEAISELEKGTACNSLELATYLHKSDATIDRIAKIIKGLRTFARSGELEPFQSYSVQEAIEDALILCGDRFHTENVELNWEIPPETLMIECRPVEIIQVLLNLMGNALDAVSSLQERWVRLQVTHTPDFVQFRVTDSGPGIDPIILDKIFQPFFTTKDIGKGTGIGLSISMGIVKGHNGRLFVDPGALNTCFVIEIPKKQGMEAEILSLEGVI